MPAPSPTPAKDSPTARRALATVAELTVAPLVLFTIAAQLVGVRDAVVVPALWAWVALGRRVLAGRQVPGLVGISVLTSTAKALGVLLSGNVTVYLLQPTATSAALGVALAASVVTGRPLVHRIVSDVVALPEGPDAAGASFMAHATILWSSVKLANAGIGLWLYATTSGASLVPTRTAATWVVSGLGAAATGLLWRRSQRVTGTGRELLPAARRWAAVPAPAGVAVAA